MKFLKNLAIMLSLVLILNTILPQAAVFAQEATNANQLAATETTANTGPTKEMTVPTVAAAITEEAVTSASMVNVTVEDISSGSIVVSGPNGQTGPGAYPYGSTLTVNVTLDAGFIVSGILAYPTAGGVQELGNTSTATLVLNEDVQIGCSFNAINYDIVVESSDTNLGTVVNTSGTYGYGENVNLSANPAPGYECISYSFTYGPDKNYIIDNQYSGPISVPVTQSGTYQLFFQPQTFNLSVVSDGNGTVTGAGNYDYNTQATITATPNPDYIFSSWTDNNGSIVSTDATETLTVTQAVKYTANFVQVAATVQASANPVAGGTVTGGGSYDFGASVSLTATPAENYRFVQWINPQTQAVISKSSNYTFTASAATSGQYTAVFEAILYPVTIKPIASGAALADITVTPSPGTGNYAVGTVLPLNAASTDSGVTFLGWYADGVLLTTANMYSYTVTGPAIITPRFNTDWGCVIASADPFSVMTVDIEVQPQGTNLNFYAPTSSTYDFVNWTNSAGTIVSTSQSLSAVVKGEFQSFIAHYAPKTFTISVVGTPTRGGTVQVTSASSMTYGKNAMVVATAVLGYSFNNWTDGDTGQIMSTTPTYTFGPAKNTNLVAHFTQNTYSLDLSANPADGGAVSGGVDNLIYGQVVNILATPDDEYIFNGWIDESGNTVSTSAKYSVTMTGNMSLTASFSEIQYPISATANPGEGGTVTGSGSFVNGTAVTLTATPSPNYNFICWTLGDENLAVNSNPQYAFTASEATQGNYTAVFELKSYSVNISLLAQTFVQGQVTLTPQSDIYVFGTVLNITAVTEDTALHFLGWYENGKEISKTQNFDYTVTQATKLSAIFVTDYGVIIAYGDPLSAQSADVIIAPKTESKTISAVTNLPYDFVNWTDSDGNSYTDAQLTVTVGPDWVTTYVAHYAPQSFEVSVAGQIPGGSASASLDSLDYGQWLTVTAEPDPGYAFLNWTDIPTGNVFSTNPNWTFLPAEDVNLQANFTHTAYTIGLNADAEGGGTVAWANYPTVGPYYGDVITAVATPDPNFVFDGWVNAAGDNVSMDSSYDYTVTGNDTLTGAFHVSQNTITAVADPTDMGTVTGGAIYNYKDQATLTATPNTGFEFINWTNNLDDTAITTPSLVVDVANDVTYTANFEILQCPVTLNFIDPSRSTYGSVQMDVSRVVNGSMVLMLEGTVPIYGDQVVLIATPDITIPNIIFKDYLDGNGALISYDSVYTIATISEPMDIQYDFVQNYSVTVPISAEWTDPYALTRTLIPGVNPQTPNWTLPEITGNFKDIITFDYGAVDDNLVFDGWYTDTDTPVLVCSDTTLSYQLLDATPLVAKLHLKDIGIMVNNTAITGENGSTINLIGGQVSGSGYRNVGDILSINTIVDADYNFEKWTQGTTTLGNSPSYVYTVAGMAGVDTTILANYSPVSFYLTVKAQPTAAGQAAPSGYYSYGTLVTVSQGNQAGYEFSHFEDGNGNTLSNATTTKAGTLTLYMTGDTTVVAVYNENKGNAAKETVEIIAAIASAAAIAAGIAAIIYFGGDEFLAEGAADLGLDLLEDLAAGIEDLDPDPDPDPDPDDKSHVLITAIASPVDGGTAIGGESYRVGEMAVLKATANSGWVFENWTCEGAAVIADPESESISFLVDEAEEGSTLTAHFNQEFTITTSAIPENGGTVTETKKVVSGETATVTATPKEGYVFDGWFENDVQVTADETYILDAVIDNHTLTAQFELGANVTLTSDLAEAEAIVTFTGDGCYKIGDEHTIAAILPEDQAANYIFEGWYADLTDPAPLSTEATYTFTLEADISLIASYKDAVTITTDATPEEGGTVTPTLQVAVGDDATVTATPNEGYVFDGWFENDVQGSEDESYILEAVAIDHSLTAQFELGANVTLTSDPAEVEAIVTFTGDGCYKIGDEHTVTAILSEDQAASYIFEGWYTDLTDPAPLSTEATYTFTLEADISLIASYKDAVTITTDATPEEGGTVTPTLQVAVGDDATVTATPNEGYIFDGWFEDGAQVSEDETYILEAVAENHDLTAQFELGANVTLTSDPAEMEPLVTLTGDGCYKIGDEQTVTATLAEDQTENYIFNGWYASLADDVALSTAASYTFTLAEDITLIASYKENSFTVDVTSEDDKMGTVSQTGTNPYKLSDSVTATAVPEKGYKFAYWSNGSSVSVSQLAEYTFDVTDDATLIANFVGNSVKIQVQCDYVEGGTVTSDDVAIPETGLATTAGESITLKAEEKKGYEFEGWYENGKKVEKEATYTFVAEKDRTLVAAFSHNGLWLLAFPDPIEGGRVYKVYQPSETKDEFYLNAVPLTGYEFVGWYDLLGIKVCDTPEYDFVGYIDHILFAKFQPIQYDVAVDIEPAQGGTVSGTGTYDYGKPVILTAIPEVGYVFNGYSDSTGNLVCADSVYTFTTREAVQLIANFSPQTYNVTATVNDPTLGSVSDAGTYPAGESVSLEASPVAGVRLVGWFENGQCVSQESIYTFTVTADRNLEVDFSNEAFVLTIMADPVSGGSVSGEGGYNPSSEADQASISAVPSPGYSFTAWLDADTGEQVSTQSSEAITLTKDTNLTAVFTPNVYQVNVTSGTGGTATGSGPFNFGEAVTLSAKADMGYAFAGWMMTDAQGNQSCISTALDYTFTLNEDWIALADINLTATFAATDGAIIIPIARGYFRGNMTRGIHLDAAIGETTSVEAIPGYGYEFTNWTDSKGNVLSEEAVYEFSVTGSTVLFANFKSTETVKLTVTEESILQGKAFLVGAVIAGEKEVESGQYVMAYAVAYPGNKFLHWVNQNGLKVSNARSYLFRISEDTTLTAVFEKTTHDIRANVDPEGTGYVFGQKTYTYGATATLTAIPIKLHYIFAYWSDENGRIKGAVSPVFKPVVNGTKTYTAHFIEVEHEITATAVPTQGGTVTGGGFFSDGDAVTLTAAVHDGYQFDGWFVNGVSENTDESWTFNATGHLAAEAHFSLIPPIVVTYQVTATAVPDQGGTVTGVGSFNSGDPVTLTATINEGYQFDGWFVNEVSASTDESWSFNASSNLTAEAHFSLNPPSVNEADRYQPILQNNSGLNVTVTGDLESILTGPGIPNDTTAYAQLILDKIDPSDMSVWDKLLINSVANGQSVGQCFNIRLNMLLFNYLLNTYGVKELSELNQPIQLSVDIGHLINEGTDFRLIRIHNGVAEESPSQLNGSILSFESQYFSSFALVYTPLPEISSDKSASNGSDLNFTGTNSNGSDKDASVKSASQKNPKTGDSNSNLMVWSWLLISGFLCAGVYLKKGKKGLKLK